MLADQLYTVLMTLVEGESFDILVGSGSGEGLEAWRRLHKRWDPLTTGRARGLLREILSPGRAKLVELQGAVERLEDLMRRYTQRRDARNGQRHTLAEDIRMAALEALLPEELERHCQLQRSRLDTYQKLREEVVLYAEARGYVAPGSSVEGSRGQRRSYGCWRIRTMERTNFFQRKGKEPTGTGKGKGTGKDGAKLSGRANSQKIQGQCWNCEKTGHQSKDCWARPQQQSQGQSNSPGKGNDVKGKNQARVEERKENPKMLEHLCGISKLEVQLRAWWHRLHHRRKQAQRLARLTRLSAQRWICARLHWQEIVNPRWIAFNVDTGAGGTVWPMNADYACEKISGPAGRNYKTATGEIVEGQGRFRVRCQSVWGHQLHMTGEKTSVHKPLLSAGDVTDKGHALWLDGNVGYIIQKDSPIMTTMRTCFQRVCEQHSWNGAIDLTKERGVYILYVQVAGGDGNVERAVDVSPNEMEVDESGTRVSGSLRPVNP